VFLTLMQTDEPGVKREAATALGRLRDKTALPILLNALAQPVDRFGEHAIIYALIEIGEPGYTRAGLKHQSAAVRRGALIALDQMPGGNLTSDEVSMLLKSADPPLVAAIVDVLSRHPEWVDQIVGLLGAQLAAAAPNEEQLNATRGAIVALGDRPEVESLVAAALTNRTAESVRLMLLETIAAATYDQPPTVYNEALAKCLESTDENFLRQAVLAIGALDASPFTARLLAIGEDAKRSSPVRLAAYQAAGRTQPQLSAEAFEFLSQRVCDAEALSDRLAAAEALGRSALTAPQLQRCLEWLRQLGPIELSWLLQAYEKQSDEKLGLALVDALAEASALDGVSPDRLAAVVITYPQPVKDAAQSLLTRTRPDDAERVARLTTLETSLAEGDAAQGEHVFFGTRAACSACHRIGTRGERIGPDLSKIGEVRTRRDLLEAILFPSASLARGYESLHVVLSDGKVQSGMLSRETAAAIFLRTTERAELRVARDAIEEMSPSRTSIMPQGLDKTLSQEELGDLVAFLRSLK
jgi:putative heme-binding domain-containing protein